MFVRKVTARLNPNSLTKFTELVESEILPWLRKQQGFLHLLILASGDGREVTAISFWDRELDAQLYHSNGYPETLEMLTELLDGRPYVKTFDVVGSTFHATLASHDRDGLNQINLSSVSEGKSVRGLI
jgi:hypothetical protein